MSRSPNILSVAQMVAAEQALFDDGISVEELMQKAGEGAAQWVWRVAPSEPILVVCGPGNNGGDGYVLAEWLRQRGVEVSVARFGPPGTDAAQAAAGKWQGETCDLEQAKPATVFVDCLFGTGQARPLGVDLFAQMQRLSTAARTRIAVDLPSGVDSDTGALFNDIAPFDLVIALGAWKPAHWLHPASAKMRDKVLVDIGAGSSSEFQLLTKPKLSAPAADAYKYSRGVVAVVAGTMPGAAWLSAQAAQKAGAGYVKIYAPTGTCYPHGSIVVHEYDDPAELGRLIAEDRYDLLLAGPGLGREGMSGPLMNTILAADKPMLLDADALHLLGEQAAGRLAPLSHRPVLTPHAGEFAKLGGKAEADKVKSTKELANRLNSVTLHKGPDTIIASPSGELRVDGMRGTSWLSIAGTGDVLSGIIAARYAAVDDPFRAACEGQWLHGRSARLAGPALTPEMLIAAIPHAISECL